MTEKLSPQQRRILTAMVEYGKATFTGHHARRNGFGVYPAKAGGCVIRAYQFPQWFLLQRGLIVKCDGDATGTWYEITPKGRAALTKEKT